VPRKEGHRRSPAAAIAAIALASSAFAGPQESDWDRVLRELEGLKDENRQLRERVDQLEAESGDAWITAAREAELRELVADVLADADVRAGNLENGIMAGWSEHFFLASADGRFMLQFDGLLQTRFVYNYHDFPDRHVYGMEITRAKLTFSGHLFNPNLKYLVRTDPTRNERGLVNGLYFLQDAWIDYDFTDAWSVRAGQFKLPFNREEMVLPQYQMAVERSLVNESLNLGRSQGVELTYANSSQRFMIAFSEGMTDEIGGFGTLVGTHPVNTEAIRPNFNQTDAEYAFSGRWEGLVAGTWHQFDDFTSPPGDAFGMLIGIGGHVQETESTGEGSPSREDRVGIGTIDLSLEFGGASAFGAFTYAYIDNGAFGIVQVFGGVIQASAYVAPKAELFARWEYGWLDFTTDFSDLHVTTVGVNYYLDGHDLKWTTDIGVGFGPIDSTWDSNIAGWRQDLEGSDPQIVFRTQLQLVF
jgi:hypothetical protein